jgi:hypothetical protein
MLRMSSRIEVRNIRSAVPNKFSVTDIERLTLAQSLIFAGSKSERYLVLFNLKTVPGSDYTSPRVLIYVPMFLCFDGLIHNFKLHGLILRLLIGRLIVLYIWHPTSKFLRCNDLNSDLFLLIIMFFCYFFHTRAKACSWLCERHQGAASWTEQIIRWGS